MSIPATFPALLRQRRRVLRGHWQFVEMLGAPPFTLQELARSQPNLASKILLAELASRPSQTLAFLVLALPIEGIAHVSATLARFRRHQFPSAWPMVD